MFQPVNDLIAAIATPPGVGGLAVIRLSGEQVFEKIHSIFKSKTDIRIASSHTVHYGHIVSENNDILDEVLVSIFRSPRSFTTQDSVEISCHGGPVVVQSILNRIMELGVRLAEPGEFTKRAFLNGRLDLAQAESVSDLIHSTGHIAQQSSLYHLSGHFSTKLKQIRQDLIDFISLLELELDFSDEDVEFASRDTLTKKLNEIIEYIKTLTDSFTTGRFIKEGVRVVIAGKPNAGKSTLLNLLLGHDRAIVSDIPGTTRDTIEETINLEGISFRFVDTAGIRETGDYVEQQGVERTLQYIDRAQVLFYLFDSTIGLSQDELENIKTFTEKNPILKVALLANKIDLLDKETAISDNEYSLIQISAAKEKGIDEVKKWLVHVVLGDHSLVDATESITNIRHYGALVKAQKNLQNALAGVMSNNSQDFISADIRNALFDLGNITGETTPDEILNNIFSKFCIGK